MLVVEREQVRCLEIPIRLARVWAQLGPGRMLTEVLPGELPKVQQTAERHMA
jgi:hypothetical protein